jgi:sugar/nucleoside kinase (ribokinase family)
VGLNAADTVLQLPHFPSLDSKVEIISQELQLGGQVATAAVACQRWGWRTRYVGKIGDDDVGRLQREAFAREGLEVQLIEVPHCPSQSSVILLDQTTGERTILWRRDTRLDMQVSELRQEWVTQARLLHVDGHPSAPAAAAAKWAREAGVIVTADLDNLYPGVELLLENVDYAIVSREFPARLTGTRDILKALQEISRRFGCKVAGATLGRDGVIAWDGNSFHYSPGFKVTAVDTTGAGDVFHAGFAHCLLRGETLDFTLEFSSAAAALNCTGAGARGGIRPLSEIEYLMRAGERHRPFFARGQLQTHS